MVRHTHGLHGRTMLLLLLLLGVEAQRKHIAAATQQTKWIPSFAGPWKAYVNMFDQCDLSTPEERAINCQIRLSHFNPKRPREFQTITGNITSTIDVNDEFWGRVQLAVRNNNQWKENAFIFNFPGQICSAARTHSPLLFERLTKLDPKDPGPCKLSKGAYIWDQVPLVYDFPNFPVMPYGHYRSKIVVGAIGSKSEAGCISLDFNIIPKPRE